MSSKRHRLILFATLLGLRCAAALGNEHAETTVRFDISVLTPAVEGKFFVASGFDMSALVPPYLSLGQIGDRPRTTALRALVGREKYDAARPLSERLLDALADATYRAVPEPIMRKPAGSIQSLSWSDLPESPQGQVMLDVTIRWLCLCSELAFTKYYPAIALGWRVLGEREIIEPTRELVYRHFPPGPRKNKSVARPRHRAKPQVAPAPEPEYPVRIVSENCGFDSIKKAEENPAVLWGCFGEAYEAAVERLVIDLKRVYPPSATLTASADTPSGISTQ